MMTLGDFPQAFIELNRGSILEKLVTVLNLQIDRKLCSTATFPFPVCSRGLVGLITCSTVTSESLEFDVGVGDIQRLFNSAPHVEHFKSSGK